jgi:putative ABC transport system permease protein
MVAAQVALALVLLAASGLLVRSFLEVHRVDHGFEPRGLLAVSLNLPGQSYPDTPDHTRFYEALLERLARLPDVRGVAATSEPPIVGYDMTRSFELEGARGVEVGDDVPHRIVAGDYFRTLGIPLLRGRTFSHSDRSDSPPVLVINQATSRRYWPGEDPVGQRVAFEPEGPWHEIVGVVGDTRHQGLEATADPATYAPFTQKSWRWLTWMTVLVRSDGDPLALAEAVRNEVWALDPNLPVLETRTVESLYRESLARRRFNTLVLSLFAGFALLLGLVKLYGVTVSWLVLRQGAALTLAGLAAGTAAALALSRLVTSLLFGIEPHDPPTFVAAGALLAALSLAACYLPARRAARLDPTRALR